MIKDGYYLPVHISLLANEATSQIYELYCNTLMSLSLTPQEEIEYERQGIEVFRHIIGREAGPVAELRNDKDIMVYIPVGDSYDVIKKIEESMIKKCVCHSFNYRIENLSDANYFFQWQRRFSTSDYIGEEIRDIDPLWTSIHKGESDLFFLKDSHNHIVNSVCELCCGIAKFEYNGRYSYRTDNIFFSDYIDMYSNWDKWLLPIEEKPLPQTTKKKRKREKSENLQTTQQTSKYKNTEQVVVDYDLKIFIPEEKMETITGFEIKRIANH